MDIKTHVSGLTPKERKTLCELVEISQSMMSQILHGKRVGSNLLTRFIVATDGRITFEDELLPIFKDAEKRVNKVRAKIARRKNK